MEPTNINTTDSQMEDDNIVKGQTRSGLIFSIDKRVADDARTVFYLRQMKKYRDISDTETAGKAVDAVYSLLELIFGTDDNLLIFMNEVASKHGGVATPGALMDELTQILEACKLKNSFASQK